MNWLQHLTPHIKHLLLAGVAAVVLWFAVWRGTAAWEHVEQIRADKAQQALQQAQGSLLSLQNQSREDAQQYKLLIAQVTADNSRLSRQIQQRDQGLKQEQVELQNAPQSRLVELWRADTGASPVALDANRIAVTAPDARLTVERLEAGRIAQADLADTRGELAGLQQELDSAKGLIGSLQQESAQAKVVLADQQKADSAACELKLAKSRKRHWIVGAITFVAGVVLGRRI